MAHSQTPYLHLDYNGDERMNQNWDRLDAAVRQLEHPVVSAQLAAPAGLVASAAAIGTLAVAGDATVAGVLSADGLDVPPSAFPFSVQSWMVGDPMTAVRPLADDAALLASLTVEEAAGCVHILLAEVTFLLRRSGLIAVTVSRNGAARKVRRVPFGLAGPTTLPYSVVIPEYWTGEADVPATWSVEATALTGAPDAVFAQLSALVIR